MDCTVCVQYGTLCMPSKKITTRSVSRLHSSFAFSPSSVALSSGGSKHRTPLGHALRPVISAQSMPSNSKDDKKFVVKGIGGASTVALACVLGLMSCNPRAFAAPLRYGTPPQSQSQSHKVGRYSSERQDMSLHQMNAKEVLKSLLMVNEHVASSSPSSSKSKQLKPQLPAELSIKDCEDLKMMAAEMIKDGKGDKAEKQLTDIYNAMRKAQKWESAYQVQMALVAILIFQGKYQQAAKCECLKVANPSDGRVHLYKAIIHTMLDRNKEAKEGWEGFVSIL